MSPKHVVLYHYSRKPLDVIRSGFDRDGVKTGRLHKYMADGYQSFQSNQLISLFSFPMLPTVRLDRLDASTDPVGDNPAWVKGTWYEHVVVVAEDVPWRIAEILLATTDIIDTFPEDGTKRDYQKWHYNADKILRRKKLSGTSITQLHRVIKDKINIKTYNEWMHSTILRGLDINPDQYAGGVPHIQIATPKLMVHTINTIKIL